MFGPVNKVHHSIRMCVQCFDASTFLQMNERKPTWNCPVCDKKALYDDLLIDGYFQEILDSKATADENEIMREKDGSWKLAPKEEDKESSDKQKAQASSGGDASSNGTATPATNGNRYLPSPVVLLIIHFSFAKQCGCYIQGFFRHLTSNSRPILP